MRMWLMASRPRTLPAAVAPVLVGTAIAVTRDVFRPGAFIAALLGAIFIQIGTNLSNDYSDARRGADTEERLGPMRVTAGGLVPPRTVLLWTYLTFGVAVLCGVYLVAVAGWEILVLGVLSILAGVLYTGGPRPYGYEGLGEVFVFLFFGLVAVAGSAFAQLQSWPWEAFALAVPVGMLVTAILVVNNIRDMDTDRVAGKRTLAVRLGRDRARAEYALLMFGAFAVLVPAVAAEWADRGSASALWWLLPVVLVVPAAKLVGVVRTHVDGPTLNGALARTAGIQLAFCVLLAAGVLLS
jgi:1,4-dihydroxy-2-naphthoate polyprenyltransferase